LSTKDSNFYHIRITRKSKRSDDLLELDLDESSLLKNIVTPYKQGQLFYCEGTVVDPFDVETIRINRTNRPSSDLLPAIRQEREEEVRLKRINVIIRDEWYVTEKGEVVTRQFINSPPKQAVESKPRQFDPKRIFIVHGRNDEAKNELARLVEGLGLTPIILHEQPNKGKTIIEKFESNASKVGYALVLLTPDDSGASADGKIQPRARQNVILELGYFMGSLGRDRVCCLYTSNIELPSDILGIAYHKFEKKVKECFWEISTELKNAGYELKL
jgi:predicted nucleotide-binding protein